MSRLAILAAAVAATVIGGAPAAAHPGPNILTQFGGKDRADGTGAATVAQIGGVHLYKGPARRASDALAGAAAPSQMHRARRHLSVNAPCRHRCWRELRTQGFWSGVAPQSRRFTQGFYSGD